MLVSSEINRISFQGPFRDPAQVTFKRYKPLEPTLRVATSYTSVEESRYDSLYFHALNIYQARRQLNWNGGGGMDSQYKLLSELLSDQAAFITSPKTSLANYWGGALPPLPPSVYGPDIYIRPDVLTYFIRC